MHEQYTNHVQDQSIVLVALMRAVSKKVTAILKMILTIPLNSPLLPLQSADQSANDQQ